MPTVLTHAVLGFAAAETLGGPSSSKRRVRILSVACATLPDLDVAGFGLGIHYGDLLGHRGLSHSLAFAVVLGTVVATVGFAGSGRRRLVTLAAYFAAVTASHGLLDAMTNGGLGIAFFSPFEPSRHFLPWRPIVVAPLSAAGLFTERGVRMLVSEIAIVWLPALLALATVIGWRRGRDARERLASAVAIVDAEDVGRTSSRDPSAKL